MDRILTLSLIILSVALSSCGKEKETNIVTPGDLVGCWVNPQYNDSTIVYNRAAEFADGPGILFKIDGSLVEKMNAGFCGTPPVTYAEYAGSFIVYDSIISVSVGYWGGTMDYALELISVNGDFLTVKRLQNSY
jgi:hypothetical protein